MKNERLANAIERLATILEIPFSHDWAGIVNTAIQRFVSDNPLREVRKVGRVLGDASIKVDGNERAIARVDQIRIIKQGTEYKYKGRMIVATKDIKKETHGWRVQFKHDGKW